MENINIKVASFKEAFNKFLSFIEGDLNPSILSSFAELKEKKKISFKNETNYWNGNHYSSNSEVELIMVEEPCLFYIVKFYYYENSSESKNTTDTFVFIV